ncbi:MAG TPA: FISUMP domain-containing protein, partial [Chitinophagaceae bacterium]|nr:FISUMP domain-containing protein [Chitinophagaceae bacterium]
YGHLFQWGRPADGHQLINYSNGTSGSPVNGKTKTLATSDAPGHSTFITPDNTIAQGGVFIYDWRNDQNTNRWAINAQGACPTGWHIPTAAEWAAETGITNLSTAFSQLKLTAPGYRYGDFDGSNRDGTVRSVGSFAYYWSSSVWPSGAGFSSYKDISSNDSYSDLLGRAYGCAIRCIKNQ